MFRIQPRANVNWVIVIAVCATSTSLPQRSNSISTYKRDLFCRRGRGAFDAAYWSSQVVVSADRLLVVNL